MKKPSTWRRLLLNTGQGRGSGRTTPNPAQPGGEVLAGYFYPFSLTYAGASNEERER